MQRGAAVGRTREMPPLRRRSLERGHGMDGMGMGGGVQVASPASGRRMQGRAIGRRTWVDGYWANPVPCQCPSSDGWEEIGDRWANGEACRAPAAWPRSRPWNLIWSVQRRHCSKAPGLLLQGFPFLKFLHVWEEDSWDGSPGMFYPSHDLSSPRRIFLTHLSSIQEYVPSQSIS